MSVTSYCLPFIGTSWLHTRLESSINYYIQKIWNFPLSCGNFFHSLNGRYFSPKKSPFELPIHIILSSCWKRLMAKLHILVASSSLKSLESKRCFTNRVFSSISSWPLNLHCVSAWVIGPYRKWELATICTSCYILIKAR